MANNIDQQFDKLSLTTAENDIKRNILIQKAFEAVTDMKLNPQEEAPRLTEIKMNLLKTADDLLKSKEDSIAAQIKLEVNNKKADNLEKNSELVASVLKKVQLATIPIATPVKGINRELGNLELPEDVPAITPGELVINEDPLNE